MRMEETTLKKQPTQQFDEVIALIKQAHTKIIYTANTTLIELYWQIGAYISDKVSSSEWGDGVVKQLAE